ncbi:hypothetical protein C4565_07310 [Candidatus Parcubacteria bacterium]|nr:MAG: hypothetical protein C4565_07310 [Candidatus Parcubacteria bacterium]
MNIYDTKLVRCSICGKFVGEISFDAIIHLVKCGQCNQTNHDDKPPKSPDVTSSMFFAMPC